jgi:3-methylfumaryl-CoA hydratase
MITNFSAWVGRKETVEDVLEPARANALRSTFGRGPIVGTELPLLYHWLYFWDVRPSDALAIDGHPARGGFLPPVPLPRRMWAGGRLRFLEPLHLGERVTRISTIQTVEAKRGRSGDLVFVTVEHQLSGRSGLAVVEEQDIVFRDAVTRDAIGPSGVANDGTNASWHHDIFPDPILLFRYSALTMNGHRIHYDQPYATQSESYPALLVQGPLQATMLLELAARNMSDPIRSFSFRAKSPAFAGTMLHLLGETSPTGGRLWADQNRMTTMVASINSDRTPVIG